MEAAVPNATVLADPAAWTSLSTTRSQYADVGTSASPMVDPKRIIRHITNAGRRPLRSATVPHSEGAECVS